jgi:hypothetical protein
MRCGRGRRRNLGTHQFMVQVTSPRGLRKDLSPLVSLPPVSALCILPNWKDDRLPHMYKVIIHSWV